MTLNGMHTETVWAFILEMDALERFLRAHSFTLFDTGYLTATDDLRVEASSRLRDYWHNGKE